MEYFLWIPAVLLILTGVVGTVVPVLPGPVLVFAGFVLAAAVDGFQRITVFSVILLGLLTAAAYAFDFLGSSIGAKRSGASGLATTGALLGTLIGFVFGLLGIVLGPFIGAFAGELWTTRDLRRAGQVGLGTWIGIAIGGAAKAALMIIALAVFLTALFV